MSFGWSAGDIFALVQVCYKVVENCTDGLVSALIQVSNLRQEVREFGQALEHLQVHLTESHELAYLNFDLIGKTLKNCNDWLEKYKQLQRPDEHSPILGTGGGEKTRIWRTRSKDLREVGLKAGQALRFNAWGGSDELQALQTALARHRQSLVLYLQILERQRRSEEQRILNRRLSEIEVKINDLHTETIHRRYSASPSPSFIPQQEPHPPHPSSDYVILQEVGEQRGIALHQIQNAETPNEKEEWMAICNQLDLIYLRVANTIKRKVNSTAQRRELVPSSHANITMNRVFAGHPRTSPPSFRPVSRIDSLDSGYFDALSPLHEELSSSQELVEEVQPAEPRGTRPVSTASQTTLVPSEWPSPRRVNSKGTNPRSSLESIPSILPPQASRKRTLSTTSTATNISPFQSSFVSIPLTGWVKISWTNPSSHILCLLEGAYDKNDRLYIMRAIDRDGSQLLVLKLSTSSTRPILHSEIPGERDNPLEGIPGYFINPPSSEPPAKQFCFWFENEKDHQKIQSLIYGQALIKELIIDKISLPKKSLTDRQYLRIWKSSVEKDPRWMLFYATRLSKPKYIKILASEIAQDCKIPKKGKDIELGWKCGGSNENKKLKLTFGDRNDLLDFLELFLGISVPRKPCK